MNARHQQFVAEYLIDLNATQAYRRVYPRVAVTTAEVNGHKLLRNAKIAAAVKAALDERKSKAAVTAEWVLERLRVEAQATGEGSTHSARVRAVELLGKHLGLFADQLKLDATVTATATVGLNVGALSDDELRQFQALLRVAAGPRPGGDGPGR